MRCACLGLADGLHHARAKAIKAADISARVRLSIDAMNVDQERGQLALRAIHLVKDIAIVIIFKGGFATFGALFKQAVGQTVFRRKLGRVKAGAHFCERGTLGRICAHFASGGEIPPTAVIAVLDTTIGFAQRRKRQLLRIIFFEKSLDRGILVDFGDSGGCRRRGLGHRRRAQLRKYKGKGRNRGFVKAHSKLS